MDPSLVMIIILIHQVHPILTSYGKWWENPWDGGPLRINPIHTLYNVGIYWVPISPYDHPLAFLFNSGLVSPCLGEKKRRDFNLPKQIHGWIRRNGFG